MKRSIRQRDENLEGRLIITRLYEDEISPIDGVFQPCYHADNHLHFTKGVIV